VIHVSNLLILFRIPYFQFVLIFFCIKLHTHSVNSVLENKKKTMKTLTKVIEQHLFSVEHKFPNNFLAITTILSRQKNAYRQIITERDYSISADARSRQESDQKKHPKNIDCLLVVASSQCKLTQRLIKLLDLLPNQGLGVRAKGALKWKNTYSKRLQYRRHIYLRLRI
jgi:hypothetical protein